MNYIGVTVEKRLSICTLYTAFRALRPIGYSFAGEAHDFWEMVFVLDGTVGICAGKKILSLSRGEAFLHKPMEFHRIWSEGQSTATTIILSFDTAQFPPLSNRIFHLTDEDMVRLERVFSHIRQTFVFDDFLVKSIAPQSELAAEMSVKELELFLLHLISCRAQSATIDKDLSVRARSFAEIVGFLEKNLHRRMDIEEIAVECGLSQSNLKKIFSKYSGIGVMAYFNTLKMRHAQLLLSGGMSVHECALALGFSDPYYFSTVFKRIMGRAPSEFKKK